MAGRQGGGWRSSCGVPCRRLPVEQCQLPAAARTFCVRTGTCRPLFHGTACKKPHVSFPNSPRRRDARTASRAHSPHGALSVAAGSAATPRREDDRPRPTPAPEAGPAPCPACFKKSGVAPAIVVKGLWDGHGTAEGLQGTGGPEKERKERRNEGAERPSPLCPGVPQLPGVWAANRAGLGFSLYRDGVGELRRLRLGGCPACFPLGEAG